VVVLESGPTLGERSHSCPESVLSGVGGAGLFSDGKFSFFPSASKLWTLRPRRLLDQAVTWLADLLAPYGLVMPKRTSAPTAWAATVGGGYRWKEYPSNYLAFDPRVTLIESVSSKLGSRVHANTSLVSMTARPDGVRVDCRAGGVATSIPARAAILATGRLGSVRLDQLAPTIPVTYRRVEVGVRLEQEAAGFFLAGRKALDPKLVLRHGPVEWRTFCCCRDGLVVPTAIDGWQVVSGRADCPPTGRSNVGFNVRVIEDGEGTHVWAGLRQCLARGLPPSVEPLGTFLSARRSTSADRLGETGSRLVREGVHRLREIIALSGDTLVHAPAVEGVGYYPKITQVLRVPDLPIYVAGDLTGRFRGLTAAMISGYFAGLVAARALRQPRRATS
jgi:uncharacterized FAD-dependent dehydrogenase